jgi:23S rRNA pseudouridine955/2504/2580 synthase
MLSYPVSIADHGRRMDSYLRNLLPAASSAYLHQLIKGDAVVVNGFPAAPGTLLRVSDTVGLKETGRIRGLLADARRCADILYEDDYLVAFNKPAGLPVHHSAEHGGHNLVEHGQQALAVRGVQVKLYPVNRLDKDTSGIAVMAKSSAKAGAFGKLFQEGLVEKRYLTVVAGRMAGSGIIDIALDDKESRSEFRSLFAGKGVTILSVTPITGRSHQIRRHMAALGHPVMGDKRYGGKPAGGMKGHALHSYRLAFRHPFTGTELWVFAPPPETFAAYLSRILGTEVATLLDSLIAGTPTKETGNPP